MKNYIWFRNKKKSLKSLILRTIQWFYNCCKKIRLFLQHTWSWWRESDPWPPPYQGGALPLSHTSMCCFLIDFCDNFSGLKVPFMFYQGSALPLSHSSIMLFLIDCCGYFECWKSAFYVLPKMDSVKVRCVLYLLKP